MRILVVGATGFIGAELLRQARERNHEAVGTTRRRDVPGLWHYDLLQPVGGLPPQPPDAAFLCAGVADYRRCEGNAEAWRVNVDGNIAAGKSLMRAGAFVVYLSSVAAEWAGHSAYGRGKEAVELALQCIGDPAIIRCERVTPAKLTEVCEILLGIGIAKVPGIYRIAP